ncbi:hypothetical protein FRC01_002352 [Tulasnella sp. 417]|nr:hypothetical protein FRC01_002352 [Tulasnella sp. 417]
MVNTTFLFIFRARNACIPSDKRPYPSGIPLGNSVTEYYLVRCLLHREPVLHTLRVIWSATPALVDAVRAEIELLVCARSILQTRKIIRCRVSLTPPEIKKEAIHGPCDHAEEDIGTPSDYIVRLESHGISESIVEDPSLKLYDIFCIFGDPELRTLEEIVSETVRGGEPYEFDDDDTVSNIMNQVAPGIFKLSGLLGVAWQPLQPRQPLDVPRLIRDLECYTDENCRSPEMQNLSPFTAITAKSDVWSLGLLAYQLRFRRDWHLNRDSGVATWWRLNRPFRASGGSEQFHWITLIDDPSKRLDVTELIFHLPATRNGIYPGLVCKCYGRLKNPAKYVVPRMSFLFDHQVRKPRGPAAQYPASPSYRMPIPVSPMV